MSAPHSGNQGAARSSLDWLADAELTQVHVLLAQDAQSPNDRDLVGAYTDADQLAADLGRMLIGGQWPRGMLPVEQVVPFGRQFARLGDTEQPAAEQPATDPEPEPEPAPDPEQQLAWRLAEVLGRPYGQALPELLAEVARLAGEQSRFAQVDGRHRRDLVRSARIDERHRRDLVQALGVRGTGLGGAPEWGDLAERIGEVARSSTDAHTRAEHLAQTLSQLRTDLARALAAPDVEPAPLPDNDDLVATVRRTVRELDLAQAARDQAREAAEAVGAELLGLRTALSAAVDGLAPEQRVTLVYSGEVLAHRVREMAGQLDRLLMTAGQVQPVPELLPGERLESGEFGAPVASAGKVERRGFPD